ncbi:hypothetical protein ASZ78_012874 [Callipepla squamata]|uniref:Ig-like domain-containing protein n=1 Tax=Callipepla squamata TaxID=9009 RepID=A0A226MIF9_CALSU|nr:hypothetical protein ASZ78_012874 [Callipepla squamata]
MRLLTTALAALLASAPAPDVCEALNVTVSPGPTVRYSEGDNATLYCHISQKRKTDNLLAVRNHQRPPFYTRHSLSVTSEQEEMHRSTVLTVCLEKIMVIDGSPALASLHMQTWLCSGETVTSVTSMSPLQPKKMKKRKEKAELPPAIPAKGKPTRPKIAEENLTYAELELMKPIQEAKGIPSTTVYAQILFEENKL